MNEVEACLLKSMTENRQEWRMIRSKIPVSIRDINFEREILTKIGCILQPKRKTLNNLSCFLLQFINMDCPNSNFLNEFLHKSLCKLISESVYLEEGS